MQGGLSGAGDEQQSRTQPRALEAVGEDQATDNHGNAREHEKLESPVRKSTQKADVSECCQRPSHRQRMRLRSQHEQANSDRDFPPAKLFCQQNYECQTRHSGREIEIAEPELEDDSISEY